MPATLAALQVLRYFYTSDLQVATLINTTLGIALILTAVTLPLKSWLQRVSGKGAMPKPLRPLLALR